jgi:hypothetical protein
MGRTRMDYLKGMSQVMQQAQAGNDSEKYGYAAVELVKSKDKIREAIEQATVGTVVEIIAKLEKNQPLSEEEKQVVRLWVVGDAEGYLKMENNLKEWLEEYRRLMDVIAGYEGKSGSIQELVEVHGVLEDAIKVADAIAHYLDDKERVTRFNNAMTNLNAQDNKFIAGILKSMMSSPDM